MSERSTFGPLGAAIAPVAVAAARADEGGRRVGHADLALPVASRPARAPASERSAAGTAPTTTSEAMPTRSVLEAPPGGGPDALRTRRRAGVTVRARRQRSAHFEHHPRVDQLVQHVGQQVDHHRQHRQVDRRPPGSPGSRCGSPPAASRGRGPGSRRTPRSGTSRRRCPAAPPPMLVRIGIIALRSTCLNSTVFSVRPLARAVRT